MLKNFLIGFLSRNQAMSRPTKRIKTKKYKEKPVDDWSPQGVLIKEIAEFLSIKGLNQEETCNDMQAFFDRDRSVPNPDYKEVELEVEKLSSNGDGICLYEDSVTGKKRVILVPYTLVGDKIKARINRTERRYFEAELVSVESPSGDRNNDLINCKYFSRCSGCQYQMVSYDKQLEIKRDVIVNAYRHYAPNLSVPSILDTVASPEKFSYRTKLTPHFDRPPKGGFTQTPPIGFGIKGSKNIVDIEECIIGTPAVNKGLTEQREKVLSSLSSYKNGATILLRECRGDDGLTYTSNPKQIITELVDRESSSEKSDKDAAEPFKFEYPAGSFFQNNNSILPLVTSYVRDNIKLPDGTVPKYLVDTYCGSGLFAITCSPAVEQVIGVEISQDSVKYAIENAKLNELKNAEFIVGQAEKIFEKVNTPNRETSIIIDPPRKGCDQAFLEQLIAFKPIKIVYVSCNVHSQARDLEYLVQNCPEYLVESIRGFDFFPQTHHVESVAVLRLK